MTFDTFLNISLVILSLIFITLLTANNSNKMPVRADGSTNTTIGPIQHTTHSLYAEAPLIAIESELKSDVESSRSGVTGSKKVASTQSPKSLQNLDNSKSVVQPGNAKQPTSDISQPVLTLEVKNTLHLKVGG